MFKKKAIKIFAKRCAAICNNFFVLVAVFVFVFVFDFIFIFNLFALHTNVNFDRHRHRQHTYAHTTVTTRRITTQKQKKYIEDQPHDALTKLSSVACGTQNTTELAEAGCGRPTVTAAETATATATATAVLVRSYSCAATRLP